MKGEKERISWPNRGSALIAIWGFMQLYHSSGGSQTQRLY